MVKVLFSRRSVWLSRKFQGVQWVTIVVWVVLLALMTLTYHKVKYTNRYSLVKLNDVPLNDPSLEHYTWTRALHYWIALTSMNTTAGESARNFLKKSVATKAKPFHSRMEYMENLWNLFVSKHNSHALRNDMNVIDQLRMDDDEFFRWAEFWRENLAEREGRISGSEERSTEMSKESVLPDKMVSTLKSVVHTMSKNPVPRKPMGDALDIHKLEDDKNHPNELPVWKRFQNNMSRHRLYDPEDPDLAEILQNLRTQPVESIDLPEGGTQIKILFWFMDGSRAMAKPKRMPIEIETLENTYYFDDYERFQAEVASFHLDRLLGFYRVPPTVTRYVNISSEIERHAPKDFKDTFYRSMIGNRCFYGECSQFCDKPFAVCGNPDLLAMSVAFYLPSRLLARRTGWSNPWQQSYSRRKDPKWLRDDNYCEDLVANDPLFRTSRRLLDLMDLATFDFIQTNLDRHSYHTFKTFANDTNIFLYDNGRAFSRSYKDEMGLLAPVTQCCRYRFSTLDRLLRIYISDEKLSERMRRSLATETIHPLLTENHLLSIDRRLAIVLRSVYKCIADKGYKHVVIDDGY